MRPRKGIVIALAAALIAPAANVHAQSSAAHPASTVVAADTSPSGVVKQLLSRLDVLRREHGAWRVDDVRYAHGESLRTLLR